MSKTSPVSPLSFFISVLSPALQIQYILGFGYLFSLAVSVFYWFLQDSRYPTENPLIFVIAAGLSFGSWLLGSFFIKRYVLVNDISIRRGAWIMVLTWVIACSISAVFFVLAGFQFRIV